jgi:multiple sugar transport system permease protein
MASVQTKNDKVVRILTHVLLIFGSILMLIPFVWMISTSLKTNIEALQIPPIWIPEKLQFSNYIKAFSESSQPFARYFANTLFIAFFTTTLQLFTSAMAAYAFSFFRFKYKDLIFYSLLGTMMIPQQALLLPNYIILSKLRWIDSFYALTIPFVASVFGIFFLRQFFMQLPKDLYEAARIDGCSRFGFFFRILLPLSIPPMITNGIFIFLGSWNSFLWPLIVTNSKDMRTIQVGLSYFASDAGTEWHLLMAASTFCVLPLIIAYFFAQKQFIEGIARSGLKG